MNRSVHDTALEWLAAGRAAMVVEVVDFTGSVPRETGTRMLVAADAVVGTIGGGHLELQAIEHARTLLAGERPCAPHEREIALGPVARPVLRRRADACAGTALPTAAPSAWPAPQPRFRLQLYGAGHVGRAIVGLLGRHRLPRALDRRARQRISRRADRRRTSSACASSRSRPRSRCAPRGACFLVLTHSHDARPAHHRGDPAARRLRLPRADRLGHQTRALRAPLRGARHRGRRTGAPDLPDRRARHRRQGARGDRDRRGGAAAALPSLPAPRLHGPAAAR